MNSKNNCPRNDRRKKRRESYNVHLHRVLNQVWTDGSISSTALLTLNSVMEDLFNRLAMQASQLTQVSGRQTLTARDVQGAVRLVVVGGELATHACVEGSKAIAKNNLDWSWGYKGI